jgi:succinate-semialdehyde dehydrogenase/glutarate-semialdehyde dehydrogenase
VHDRRIPWIDGLMADARQRGATVHTGGERIGNKGYFYQPTVLTGVGKDARMMNEEPFGPLAMISSFKDFDEVVEEANRLPYGLASYAFTRSAKTANAIASKVESGMMTINHLGLALPEVPFGGMKDSGYVSDPTGGGQRPPPCGHCGTASMPARSKASRASGPVSQRSSASAATGAPGISAAP